MCSVHCTGRVLANDITSEGVLSTHAYHRCWLLSECTSNSWQQGNMRLTRNSRLINGWEKAGGAFAAPVKLLVQHHIGRASSEYFGECHSWPSHLQTHLAAACQRDTNLGTGEEQRPCCQSSQACYCPWPCSLRVFAGVLAFPQARRDHHLWSYQSKIAW